MYASVADLQTEKEPGSRCIGRQVDGFDHCLAHLQPEQLDLALWFGPGADLEAPGTATDAELLTRILCQVATESEPASFGDVSVTLAQFTEDVSFADVRFNGSVAFDGAQFVGEAGFQGAQFSGKVSFFQAQFSVDTRFSVSNQRAPSLCSAAPSSAGRLGPRAPSSRAEFHCPS